jgi:hypothetical protein
VKKRTPSAHRHKRASAAREDLEAAKRAFWQESAEQAFRRAARAVRAGELIEERNRSWIALWLEELANRERLKIQAMSPILLRAQMADYIQARMRISLQAAAAAVAGEHKLEAILRAVARLRSARRKRSKSRHTIR